MKRTLLYSLPIAMLIACNTAPDGAPTPQGQPKNESDLPNAPVAEVQAATFTEFGKERVDPYFWLRDKSNPAVIDYLKAENAYTDTAMAHTKAMQETLFQEMKGRIKEDDTSVPTFDNGYFYYSRTEKDKQYRIHCRKKGSLDAPEEIFFDENKAAEGQPAFILAGLDVSPDTKTLAYLSNNTGSYAEFTLKFRDLTTGQDLPDLIPNAAGTAWASDSRTVFYTVPNAALRPYRLQKHTLGNKQAYPLIIEEKDEQFSLDISRSKTGEYLFLNSYSFTSSEVQYLKADQPNGQFQIFAARQPDVLYAVIHHKSQFFIHLKDNQNRNYQVLSVPLSGFQDRKSWKVVVPNDPVAKIEDVEEFADYLALSVRSNGLQEIRLLHVGSGKLTTVNFPEPVYALYTASNPEYETGKLRYVYASLNRPRSTFEYDMTSGQTTLLKQQEIPSGFNPDLYEVKRLWATAPDGVKVPMAIVYRKGLQQNGSNPTMLYSYGSYGASTDAYFYTNMFSLVDRGFIFAIAQIRGGSEMGEEWYENGKLLNKKNTFTDFIACAEHLVKEKYTSPEYLAINGGSAGGLLVGAVTNMRPDLFKVVIAEVPFVDVINTMLDTSLPLTTQEYEQWGDPHEQKYYDYMISYSPYDNIAAKNYPNILATGGLNDSQVLFHEPAKYVAKLRSLKTDNNLVLLKTNMESGHGGATGRYDYLKEEAFNMAFIMDRLGILDKQLMN